jgi:hypothetical protein
MHKDSRKNQSSSDVEGPASRSESRKTTILRTQLDQEAWDPLLLTIFFREQSTFIKNPANYWFPKKFIGDIDTAQNFIDSDRAQITQQVDA